MRWTKFPPIGQDFLIKDAKSGEISDLRYNINAAGNLCMKRGTSSWYTPLVNFAIISGEWALINSNTFYTAVDGLPKLGSTIEYVDKNNKLYMQAKVGETYTYYNDDPLFCTYTKLTDIVEYKYITPALQLKDCRRGTVIISINTSKTYYITHVGKNFIDAECEGRPVCILACDLHKFKLGESRILTPKDCEGNYLECITSVNARVAVGGLHKVVDVDDEGVYISNVLTHDEEYIFARHLNHFIIRYV